VSEPNVDEGSTVYGPEIGPSLGPDVPAAEDPTGSDADADASAEMVAGLPPGSPYSAHRAMLRNLTLPVVPDLDIPPSPPGSPSAATNKKFENFLELKKKGVHFNSRLADTPAMRNPALVDKLLGFAELDHRDQYRTTLPTDLWDPDAFPRHAYKEQLRQSQSDIAQAKARAPGTPVSFVASEAAQASTQDGKVPQGPSTGKRKTRFDT
jgi:hypothetical protein